MLSYGSFIALINDRALNFPSKEIFHYLEDGINVDKKFTYKQLLERCQQVSFAIKDDDAYKVGQKVLLLLPQNLEFISSFLGTIYAGCVPVTAYPPKNNRNLNRILSIIDDSDSSVIITLSKIKNEILLASAFKQLLGRKRIICLDELHEKSPLDKRPAFCDEMFIQYTSGSTGSPKGVVLTHANVLANLEMIKQSMQLSESSTFYSWLPFFHDMGLIGCILTPIYVNCPSYLTNPGVFIRDPKSWLKGITKYKATITGAPNFAFDYLNRKIQDKNEEIDLSSLKVFFNGAEPVRKNTMVRFIDKFGFYGLDRNAIFPCYGMAEATLLVSGAHLRHDFVTQDRESLNVVSCGATAEGMLLKIVSPTSHMTLPDGEEGEILISGKNVTAGYLNEKEKDRFVNIDGEIFFRSGDLGVLFKSNLYVTGRIKDLIKINGINYYPDDLEKELTDNIVELNIGGCAAVGIQDANDERLVIVGEIDRKYIKTNFVEIIHKINYVLTKNLEIRPSRILLLKPGHILKTSSGKLQRSDIRKAIQENKLEYLHEWSAINTLEDSISEHVEKTASTARDDKVEEILTWIGEYFKNRIDITYLNEKRTITPNIVLDFASKGIMGMIVPQKYGGLELSLRDIFRIVEKIAYHDISLSLFVGLNNILGIFPIVQFASEEIKKKALPQMAKGMALGAFAITEKSAGSNPRNIEATAKKDGKEWILNGEKIWVGNAAWSKYINAYFKDYDKDNHYVGISGFLLDTDDMSISFGKEDLTMGVRPMIQSTVLFKNTKVTEETLLSSRGSGLNASYRTMNLARLGLSSIAIGSLSRGLDIAKEYAQHRHINTGIHIENGYTDSEIHKIECRLNTLKLYSEFCISTIELEENSFDFFALVSKIVAPEFLWTSIDRCMQILGGRGYMEDNVLSAMLRDARLLRIFEGPTEALEYHLGSLLLSVEESKKLEKNVRLPRNNFKDIMASVRTGFPIAQNDLKKDHLFKVYLGRLFCYEVLKEIIADKAKISEAEFLKKEIEKIKMDFSYALSVINSDSSVVVIEEFKRQNKNPSSSETVFPKYVSQPVAKKNESLKAVNSGSTDSQNIETLKKIFLEVSSGRVNVSDPKENILNYGLDSIMAIEASMRIEEIFGVTFPEHVLWEVNTLEKILLHINHDSLVKVEN